MKTNRNSGFTLIELLVVIVIITAVAALIVGASRYAWLKAKNSRAQAEIAAMENAIESFKSDNGYYPYSTAVRATTKQDLWNNSALLYTYLTEGPKVYFVFTGDQIRTGTPVKVQVTVDSCPPIVTNIPNIWCIDPFDNPYNYFHSCTHLSSQTNQATYDLWSYGADGKNDEGVNDDISNWTR